MMGCRITMISNIDKERLGKEPISGADNMWNRNRPPSIDRRDEIVLAIIAVLIPLATLPAMLGL
jgi:hypothetical protein